ncbi:MAG: DUF4215 domain-containing protein, partial [Sandaracinaceae bacterium]|nr:DUF4215 domain-containing protein [Sandaracinaceae bacterium]
MTGRISVVLSLAFAWGCGGPGENGDGGIDAAADAGADGGASCVGAADGTPCGDGRICLRNLCEDSACGDGVVDARTEDCDDMNTTAGDGCEDDCSFSCTSDPMCDDFQPCNGAETCSPTTHACGAGTPLADGTACGGGSGLICLDGACVPTRCGDGVIDPAAGEECEDGNDVAGDGCENDCTFTCEADGECPDDGESCNGSPVCDTTAHTCGTSTPPDTGAACTSASGAPGTCQAMVCVA